MSTNGKGDAYRTTVQLIAEGRVSLDTDFAYRSDGTGWDRSAHVYRAEELGHVTLAGPRPAVTTAGEVFLGVPRKPRGRSGGRTLDERLIFAEARRIAAAVAR